MGSRSLCFQGDEGAAIGSPVFAPSKDIAKMFEQRGYALLSSPKIYPGQIINAQVSAGSEQGIDCRLYLSYYGENDEVTYVHGAAAHLSSDQNLELEVAVPEQAHPVFELGIELLSKGVLHLDCLKWTGTPKVNFSRPAGKGTMWRRAWVASVDSYSSRPEPYRLVQNQGTGLLIQGSRDWINYHVEADITPHLARSVGIAGRVQGVRRYYSLVLNEFGELRLNKMLNEETCLKSVPFDWSLGDTLVLSLTFDNDKLIGCVNGDPLIEMHDQSLSCGGIGLLIEEGRTSSQEIRVSPIP